MTRDMRHMTCGGGGKTSIGATIRIGREIRCLPYAGFFIVFIKYIFLGVTFTLQAANCFLNIPWELADVLPSLTSPWALRN